MYESLVFSLCFVLMEGFFHCILLPVDLKKTGSVNVTVRPPRMHYQCSVGQVQPPVTVVLTVPGETPITVQSPNTAELSTDLNPALVGENFACGVRVSFPPESESEEDFPILCKYWVDDVDRSNQVENSTGLLLIFLNSTFPGCCPLPMLL